jgi:hypothetical protein
MLSRSARAVLDTALRKYRWLIGPLIFLLTSRLHFGFRARGRRSRIVVLCATGQKCKCSKQRRSHDFSYYPV